MTTTNPPNYRQPHVFDPVHNGADECECGLIRDAGIHPPSSPPPAVTEAGEQERRFLTAEELADIERFQRQRRKHPVAADAWLYVAEIDRLLTHIRLEREQLENEIFQDATDPAWTAALPSTLEAIRAAVREVDDLFDVALQGGRLYAEGFNRAEVKRRTAAILSRYFGKGEIE